MSRPSRPWFRFYTEAMADQKLRTLPPAHRWLWVGVLSAARVSSEPGFLLIGDGIPHTSSTLADFCALKERDVESGMVEFQKRGMVERDLLGTWWVPKFSERQYESDSSTARTRKHRSPERNGNVPETDQITETETETETPPPLAGPPRKRGTRIPDEFPVDADMRQWVESECPKVDWRFETGAFVDHWKSTSRANAVKLDWVRAWRNWMREAQRRTRGR